MLEIYTPQRLDLKMKSSNYTFLMKDILVSLKLLLQRYYWKENYSQWDTIYILRKRSAIMIVMLWNFTIIFSEGLINHKYNGTSCIVKDTFYKTCLTSCQMTYDLGLQKIRDWRQSKIYRTVFYPLHILCPRLWLKPGLKRVSRNLMAT